MIQRLSLSEFRKAIRAVVRRAEDGNPTVLTHYRRDVAALVPMNMFVPPGSDKAKKTPQGETPRRRRDVAS